MQPDPDTLFFLILDRAALGEAIRGGVRSSRGIYLWILGHIAEQRGNRKPRMGEKTPYYTLLTSRINELFPRAQFIHLYRDPRDVVASFLEQYWSSGVSAFDRATYVKHVYRRTDQLAATVGPTRFTEVKYETLVAHPERELRRLCAFLGEDYDPAMLNYEGQAEDGYLEVEEDWKGMTRKPLTHSRIGRYADRLTPRQIWTVEQVLGAWMTPHGYERNFRSAGSLRWQGRFWAERVYRGVLRSVGIRKRLLDAQAVVARRNELVERKRATVKA